MGWYHQHSLRISHCAPRSPEKLNDFDPVKKTILNPKIATLSTTNAQNRRCHLDSLLTGSKFKINSTKSLLKIQSRRSTHFHVLKYVRSHQQQAIHDDKMETISREKSIRGTKLKDDQEDARRWREITQETENGNWEIRMVVPDMSMRYRSKLHGNTLMRSHLPSRMSQWGHKSRYLAKQTRHKMSNGVMPEKITTKWYLRLHRWSPQRQVLKILIQRICRSKQRNFMVSHCRLHSCLLVWRRVGQLQMPSLQETLLSQMSMHLSCWNDLCIVQNKQ